MRSARPVITLISALTATERARSQPQLGVLSLAAVLKARDVHTEIIDLNELWSRSGYAAGRLFRNTIATVLASRPLILGFSTICSTYPLTLRLAQVLKQECPGTPVVIGGPQASAVDVVTLNAFPLVDFVLRGEAEETLPMLVDFLLKGRSPSELPGLTFRHGSKVQRNPDAPPIANLDTLPLPSLDAYADVSQWPSLPLEIGRGCPFSCRFCSTSTFFRRRYRLKSTDHVIRQMASLSRQYGVRAFDLIHDLFTVDRRRVAEFCRELLARGAPYNWSCSARTDCVDKELLRMMRDAGCTGIFFGIETGSARLQRFIGKGLDLDHARAVLREADRLGIETTASLIIGYPSETENDLQRTLSCFRNTLRLDQADPQLHVLAPYAATSLETEYRSRLVFEETSCDNPEFGAAQGIAERQLIKKHPEVFVNFYAFPSGRPRATLLHMSEFLINLSQRCRGLLLALTQGPCSPLQLFETWERHEGHRHRSIDYYRGLKFVDEFLAFVSATYVGRGSVAVDVMCRFYGALAVAGSNAATRRARAGEDEAGQSGGAMVRLSPSARIVSVRGDVVRVLDDLKKGRKPHSSCRYRVATVAVKKEKNGRSVIARVSPLAAAILGCLDGSVDEIIQELTAKRIKWENRVPAQFVPEALHILECSGYVSRTAAESSRKRCCA
jgi:radical SAM superfamily enzyme YgiQ (UPF0313 family)